uniref:Uncharacterized protein n=1 Tax=Pseudomonas fluorescens (strain SBW25) TaxID=216595 RepID=A0A0G4E5F9_PSEFS|nr:hypothetical protein [Pseudomonas fluorescens]CEK42212.1 hypothetical protein PQBR57_0259 [Pseudomonas fluorescens SBW25]
MKAHKLLQSTVIYVFFFGLSTAGFVFSAGGDFARGNIGFISCYVLFVALTTGTLSVLCYRDLRSMQNWLGAPDQEAHQPEPEQTTGAA